MIMMTTMVMIIVGNSLLTPSGLLYVPENCALKIMEFLTVTVVMKD